MKEYIFVSGLPRSGSTLLTGILTQNKNLFVNNNASGCANVLDIVKNNWESIPAHKDNCDYKLLRSVLVNILQTYFVTNKNIVVDKNNDWIALIEMIEHVLDKKAKILVPVRDIREIISSFELHFRDKIKNGTVNFNVSDHHAYQTLEGRCELWMRYDGPIGSQYNKVRDAVLRGYSDRLHYVELDKLTVNPEEELERIYKFLEIEPYKHDFDNVLQSLEETPSNVFTGKIQPVEHKAFDVLGYELAQKHTNGEFWKTMYY